MQPKDSDRMHCVAFVISAMGVSAMDADIVKKFKDIRKEARERGKDLSAFSKAPSPPFIVYVIHYRTSSHCHPDKS